MANTTKTKKDDKKLEPHLTWDEVLVTEEWLKKLKDELEFLKTDKRKQVADRLKEAISYWDLSENSEYSEAKEEQAFVEWRIVELEKKVKKAKVISSDSSWNKINLWSNVEIENLETKKTEKYSIVWATEAEPFEWKISNESPVWKALIGKKKWDEVVVSAPRWEIKYKILKVK